MKWEIYVFIYDNKVLGNHHMFLWFRLIWYHFTAAGYYQSISLLCAKHISYWTLLFLLHRNVICGTYLYFWQRGGFISLVLWYIITLTTLKMSIMILFQAYEFQTLIKGWSRLCLIPLSIFACNSLCVNTARWVGKQCFPWRKWYEWVGPTRTAVAWIMTSSLRQKLPTKLAR